MSPIPGSAGKSLIVKLGTAATPGTPIVVQGITNANLTRTAPDVNTTGTGDTNQTHVTGLADASFALSGFMLTATDAQFSALAGTSTAVAAEIAPLGTVAAQGNPKYTGSFYVSEYSPSIDFNGPVGIAAALLPASNVTFGTY